MRKKAVRQKKRMEKMRISDLKGKKIAVWGLGTEGVQAVRYLTAKEITDKIVLFNDTEAEKPECCRPFELICGEKIAASLDRAEVIIRSPGVSIYREELAEARRRGIVVTSVTDLCLNEFCPGRLPGNRRQRVQGQKHQRERAGLYLARNRTQGCPGRQYRPADD